MKNALTMIAIAICMLAGNVVNAQGYNRMDRRYVNKTRPGRLTAMEMRQINLMKRDLQREIRIAKADGIITMREQRSIDRQRRALDRMIYMQRRDA